MWIKQYIKKLLFPNTYSSEAFVRYLRKCGLKIGNYTHFTEPRTNFVDPGRRPWIQIGEGCCITRGVQFIAHDHSWTVLLNSHKDFYPSGGGPIKIGNNVFIGFNSIILRNVTIGDNSIIGAGSVVTSDISENSVVAGNPARFICTLDEYYEKRKKSIVLEAKNHARFIYSKKGRFPTIEEMERFTVIFLKMTEDVYQECINKIVINTSNNIDVKRIVMAKSPIYSSYDEFLKDTFNHI